jgi:hypothetical protein
LAIDFHTALANFVCCQGARLKFRLEACFYSQYGRAGLVSRSACGYNSEALPCKPHMGIWRAKIARSS